MPEYIASVRDRLGDSSIKISADTDSEAFSLAKRKYQIVMGLERIERDGSLIEITGIAFDSRDAKIRRRDLNEDHHQRAVDEQNRRAILQKIILVFVGIVFIWLILKGANYYLNAR